MSQNSTIETDLSTDDSNTCWQ